MEENTSLHPVIINDFLSFSHKNGLDIVHNSMSRWLHRMIKHIAMTNYQSDINLVITGNKFLGKAILNKGWACDENIPQ